MNKSIAIIPCKTDSTRIKQKNLKTINNQTLLEISIKYALNSNLIDKVFVSTESSKVREIANRYSINLVDRSSNLLGDAEVCDVYVDVIKQLHDKGNDLSKYEYVIGLQPDHPDRDNNLDKLIKYAYENKYDDLFTVSSQYVRTGSVRIIRMKHILNGYVSRRVGSFLDRATNIHSLEDLKLASDRINSNYKD